jgi:hypothetical protein
MKRTEVTIEEFHSGNVTEKVASLAEIRAGEGFICVDRPPVVLPYDHKWPVWERVENSLFRNRKNEGEADSYIHSMPYDSTRGAYDFFRVKE